MQPPSTPPTPDYKPRHALRAQYMQQQKQPLVPPCVLYRKLHTISEHRGYANYLAQRQLMSVNDFNRSRERLVADLRETPLTATGQLPVMMANVFNQRVRVYEQMTEVEYRRRLDEASAAAVADVPVADVVVANTYLTRCNRCQVDTKHYITTGSCNICADYSKRAYREATWQNSTTDAARSYAVVADNVVVPVAVADNVVADIVVADIVVADNVVADNVVADNVVADNVVANSQPQLQVSSAAECERQFMEKFYAATNDMFANSSISMRQIVEMMAVNKKRASRDADNDDDCVADNVAPVADVPVDIAPRRILLGEYQGYSTYFRTLCENTKLRKRGTISYLEWDSRRMKLLRILRNTPLVASAPVAVADEPVADVPVADVFDDELPYTEADYDNDVADDLLYPPEFDDDADVPVADVVVADVQVADVVVAVADAVVVADVVVAEAIAADDERMYPDSDDDDDEPANNLVVADEVVADVQVVADEVVADEVVADEMVADEMVADVQAVAVAANNVGLPRKCRRRHRHPDIYYTDLYSRLYHRHATIIPREWFIQLGGTYKIDFTATHSSRKQRSIIRSLLKVATII